MAYLVAKSRAEARYRNHLNDLYDTAGGIPAKEAEAIRLRMNFFTRYILDRNNTDYATNTEKDWAYVARRYYWYDVKVKAFGDAIFCGLLASMVRMFMTKRFIWWPFLPTAGLVYIYRSREQFILHNKQLFDMCNVGEEYELGFARNVVLK